MFCFGGVLKLCGDLAGLVGPLSISYIVNYIEVESLFNNNNNLTFNGTTAEKLSDKYVTNINSMEFPSWNDFLFNGWIISLMVLIFSILQGTLSQASTHLVNMEGIKLKNALQGLIYRKTMLLTSNCISNGNGSNSIEGEKLDKALLSRKSFSQDLFNNNEANNVGNITNLMSEDTFNVMSFFWIAHYVWAIPLKISVVIYLLYNQLGPSAIYGSLICIVIMTPMQFLIGKMMSNNMKKGTECTDERLKKINEVLIGIKLIKLNAWEKLFKEKITNLRNNELVYLDKDSIYWSLMTFLTYVSSILITFVTLLIYFNINDEIPFTASRLFTALALFNQLTVPLFIFPITIPIIISAVVSTKRLETFLRQPEVEKELEGVKNMARFLSQSDASLDILETTKDNVTQNDKERESTTAPVSIPEDSSLTPNNTLPRTKNQVQKIKEKDLIPCLTNSLDRKKVTLKKGGQVTKTVKYGKQSTKNNNSQRNSEELSRRLSGEFVASINDAIFSWKKEDYVSTVTVPCKVLIPKGKLTLIIGKNGSGKSSLLSALLHEMFKLEDGTLVWDKYATIAYLPQSPWLLNATIRENILFGESYRPRRYQKVLEACSLLPDLELLPGKDLTEIGERGINLSGGQRQRICLARALYSSANVVLLDDPLSSLDNEVGKSIIENCIKKMLLRYNRTTILVTQKLQLVYNADVIIAMDRNRVRAFGTLQEIEKSHPDLWQEWNTLINKQNSHDVQMSPNGKTAHERWRLFKNIAKLGLQKTNILEEDSFPSTSLSRLSLFSSFKKRTGSIRTRLLTHDLPLPIDEYNDGEVVLRRKGVQRKRNCASLELKSMQQGIFRGHNVHNEKIPVTRHASSPIPCPYNGNTSSNNNLTAADFEAFDKSRKVSLRQFIRRMSSRRKKSSQTLNETSGFLIRDKWKNNGSIQSINEEQSPPPLQRLMSTISRHSDEHEDPITCKESETSNRIISDEERKYGEIPHDIYQLYLKSCGIKFVTIFFLSALGWQLLRVYTDVWLQKWTNNENQDINYYFKIYTILSVICLVMAVITTPSGQLAGSKARKILHEKLTDSILRNSLYYFQTTPIGRIMNRFSNDTAVVDKKIAATIQRLFQFVLLCGCAILINAAITPWFLLITVPICILYHIVQKFYRCSSRELQRLDSLTSSPVLSHFAETISGVVTIRAYNQESRFMEILFQKIEANNVAFNIMNSSNRWLGIALDYLGGVIVFLAIITSLITAKLYPASTSSSLVGLAINYTLLIPIYLNWVVKLFADMEMQIGAVERIQYYIDCGKNDRESDSSGEKCPVPISWPQKGDIVFQNVSLRYEKGKDCVITSLNLQIPAGQKIGICGRTGSGKSTLAMSLFRTVQIAQGTISIDDIDISLVNLEDLRSRLSIIPQDVFLFSGTLRENLDPRGYFLDHELWSALETAQLKNFVNAQPMGLNFEVKEGGMNFSAGERQLFCLARSILRGSICLILDEATSSLDDSSEQQLLKAVNKAFNGRTIINIAHRVHTLLDYDRVIVLENGKIIEDGDPRNLRIDSESKFASLLRASNVIQNTKETKS
uniref:CSON006505 protein n=1 Tax=Culicoides sonorensis TaxID=179676 RepID=A0A336MWM4_CULSO